MSSAIERRNESTAIVGLPPRETGETNTPYMYRLSLLLPPPPENVAEMIADRILAAESMQEQNELWESVSSQKVAGRRYIFHGISMQPSDRNDGLPFYLVAHVTDCQSGEKTVLTTGSRNICAALLLAHFQNALPWEGEVVASKPNPKTGNVALHMRWLGRVVSDRDDDDE